MPFAKLVMYMPNLSLDSSCYPSIISDYLQGMSLRAVAAKYHTDHHRIHRILDANSIEVRPKSKVKPITKYSNAHIAKYGNMLHHLRFDVELDWLLQFSDFDKLKFLNGQIVNKDGDRFNETTEWYISYIEHFYPDSRFNSLYFNYLSNSKNRYLKPSLDHIVPRSKGGTNSIDNLRYVTYFENMCRRDIDLSEWETMKSHIYDYFI